ncbi:MAG: hypothetical protein ACI9UU_001234 [Candidatus Azotimanducaceae bacterium]|jgi:hypothetical protein
MFRLVCLVVMLVAAVMPGEAQGWSKNIHSLICSAAYELTSDQGRALVDRYSEGKWPSSCQWADEVRYGSHKETYEYHFINVPQTAARDDVNLAVDCAAHDCVHQAVKRYAVYLSAEYTSDKTKREALKFLGHFIGDLHQPLHVGYLEDRGGNTIKWSVPGSKKKYTLHAIWDGIIPEAAGLKKRGAKQALLKSISARDVRQWRSLDFEAVIQVSYDLARSHAYTLSDGSEAARAGVLRPAYTKRAVPIVTTQIGKAAVRLAHLLHIVGAGQFDPVDMKG